MALDLKPFAQALVNGDYESGYYKYPALYGWEQFLNSHSESGNSPATILFKKFDDGWRIVDETGKSEKDFTN